MNELPTNGTVCNINDILLYSRLYKQAYLDKQYFDLLIRSTSDDMYQCTTYFKYNGVSVPMGRVLKQYQFCVGSIEA